MENKIDFLIELAESCTPVTLSSLINTFDIIYFKSTSYSGYYTFKPNIYGAQIRIAYNENQYYIYFVPYNRKAKYNEECKLFDNIKIVQIYDFTKSKYLYFNNKYLRS